MNFSHILLSWYPDHHRSLPWRETGNPYYIWLSEIILQQTRVQQGIGYYQRFVERFPTVADLATADPDEVLKLWQGLGYYSRAHNLMAAARVVHHELGGEFPASFKGLRDLKGVGDYTAAAVASFAFGLPHAVVDGNVYRVLSRVFGVETPIDSTAGKKEFKELAQTLIDTDQPGMYNQAIMEFGSLQCVPRNPSCTKCPAQSGCWAYANKKVDQLPVKAKKTKTRDRFFHYLVLRDGEDIFLEKRDDKGIWKNLYQFPLVEVETELGIDRVPELEDWQKRLHDQAGTVQSHSGIFKHILSHQKIYARFWEVQLTPGGGQALDRHYIRVSKNDLDRYAIPRLIERFLEGEAGTSQIGLPLKFD